MDRAMLECLQKPWPALPSPTEGNGGRANIERTGGMVLHAIYAAERGRHGGIMHKEEKSQAPVNLNSHCDVCDIAVTTAVCPGRFCRQDLFDILQLGKIC